MPLSYLTPINCPKCNADFRIKRVPKHLRKVTEGDGWYYSVIWCKDNADSAPYWKCPKCDHQWAVHKVEGEA